MSFMNCIKTAWVPILFVSLFSPLWAQVTASPSTPLKSRNVASFNGKPITEEDLRKAAAADLDNFNLQVRQMTSSLARTEHNILEKNLLRLLADKLFEAEAAKRGITQKELLDKELEGKVKDPTPQDIEAFYEANKQIINKPLAQASDEIRQYLKTENRDKAIGDFADRLKADYKVSMFLPPLRSAINNEGSPSQGSKDAPVTIVEFSDFQCSYCSRLSNTLRDVVAKYGDKVQLVYRQFPLSQMHSFAEKAAEASLCAADQNQFWQMHNLMFETQNLLKVDDLKAKAARLNLDTAKFNLCLDSGKYAEKVKNDLREGIALGLSATPALFVNGRFLAGAMPLSDISRIIDEEMIYKSLKTTAAAKTDQPGKAGPTAKNN